MTVRRAGFGGRGGVLCALLCWDGWCQVATAATLWVVHASRISAHGAWSAPVTSAHMLCSVLQAAR
jgi:hypothetical protein